MSRGRDLDEGLLDVGLQAERTAMAWQRTALGLGAVSALLLHDAGGARQGWGAAPGVAGLLLTVTVLLAAERRHDRAVAAIARGASPAAPRALLAVASGLVVVAVGAVLALTLPWLR